MECNLEIEINERKDRKVMNCHRKMGESCVIYYKVTNRTKRFPRKASQILRYGLCLEIICTRQLVSMTTGRPFIIVYMLF